ncbi:MAG: PhoH family protein [Paludibacteraceae bacterium]|nr:PhoH family protein [Paludibacteraceae bacterium]
MTIEQTYTLPYTVDLATFYGVNNQNLITLRDLFPTLRLMARGYTLKLSGEESVVNTAMGHLETLANYCIERNNLTPEHVAMLCGGESLPISSSEPAVYAHGGKAITPRHEAQQAMSTAIEQNDLLFAEGPAGTGKTFWAVALAVKALKGKEVKRIVLCRPAVEAGEKLGFLPGDMKEKIDPYLQPLYDALITLLPPNKLREYMENGTVEIAPLAFMRGRTLRDSFVVIDEAQNTTVAQMKMVLTRLGESSKMVVTGDLSQTDLPRGIVSGLGDALYRLKGVKGIEIVQTTESQVVRHPLVRRIIAAYRSKPQKEENIQTEE